jgi:FKBP-type peptidyl-prolyl cis-trans isomerase
MKKLILSCSLLALSASLLAQAGKTPAKPVTKIAKSQPITKVVNPQPPLLKTLNDSASYSIGLSIASFCKQQGITKPSTVLVTRSFTDVMGNKPLLLSEAASNECINKILSGQKVKPPTKPVISKVPLKTANDSASYAIGLNHASFFKQQGIEKLNTALISKALNDILANKPPVINDRVANTVMNKIIIQIQEAKSKPVIDAGRAFLENNRKRPEVKTTASGLQYEIITEGTGIKPTLTDTFVANYRGTLIDGTEFDNSYKRGQPLVYPLVQVVRGWTEGLQLMSVGSKYNFYIPYELGYGAFGNPPAIPGGAALIFELELLDVKRGKTTEPVKPGN